MAALRALGVSCDGNHPHLPWRQGTSFATKHEAEYAEVLCMKVADLLAEVQGRDCDVEHAVSPLAAAAADSAPVPQAVLARKAKQKAATGYQPRAGKFAAVVPEYESLYTVHVTNDEAKQVKDVKAKAGSKGWLTTDLRLHGGMIPRGARLVSMTEGGSGIGCRVQVGVPWSQEDFLEQAQKAEHPFSKQALLRTGS